MQKNYNSAKTKLRGSKKLDCRPAILQGKKTGLQKSNFAQKKKKKKGFALQTSNSAKKKKHKIRGHTIQEGTKKHEQSI